jgi:DNA-directed RNA polymerase specialized sigma24 family protein
MPADARSVKPADLDIWITEGFTPAFYRHLERFTRSLYKKYSVNESFELFYDNVRTKVEEILTEGVYVPTKGSFKSFVYTMIRNEATKANSKNKRSVHIDDPSHAHLAATLTRSDTPEVTAVKSFREDFILLAERRSVCIDQVAFEGDLHDGRITSMVLAYVWLLQRGGCRGIGV